MIYTEKDIEHMMSFYPKHLRHLYFAYHPKYSIEENNMKENKENNDSFKGILHEYSKPNQKLELFSSKLTGNGHILENPMGNNPLPHFDKNKEMGFMEKNQSILKKEIEILKKEIDILKNHPYV